MIRAVIDTNLLVRYAIKQGNTLSRIMSYWQNEAFCYLTSPQILAEIKDVLQRPRLRTRMTADIESLIDLVETDTHQTPGTLVLDEHICRDPKDVIFIACAVEGLLIISSVMIKICSNLSITRE